MPVDNLYGVPQRRKLSPLDYLYGAGEMAANMWTGTLGQLGGGLAYLPAYAAGGNEAGQATMKAVQDTLTYQPRGELMQRVGTAVGDFVAPFAHSATVGAQTFADNVYNATGSPLIGAAARTAPAAIAQLAGSGKLSNLGGPVRRDITAYHGSPHDFDQFSTSKIGTGEGAQVYGHGLYFAESPDVAASYRDALRGTSDYGKAVRDTIGDKFSDDVYAEVIRKAWHGNSDPMKAARQVQNSNIEARNALSQEQIAAAIVSARSANAGRLYTVDIPDEHVAKFLDWDKPLSQQPESVRNALSKWFDEQKTYPGGYSFNEHSGETLMNALKGRGMSQSQISNTLNGLGIKGIRYLDQGSRGTGTGTSNFVVFDDKLIKMLKKE